MSITLTQIAPAPPGYGRAHVRQTVMVRRYGRLEPLSNASWRPYLPGTDNAYTGPLYDDESATEPMTFPALTGPEGTLEFWSPSPVRLELSVWYDGWPPVRAVVTALFTEDLTVPEADGLYVNVPGDTMTGPLVIASTQIPEVVPLRVDAAGSPGGHIYIQPFPSGRSAIAFGTGTGGAGSDTIITRGGGGPPNLEFVGSLLPSESFSWDLGNSSKLWKKLWVTDAEFTNVPTVGGVSLDDRYVNVTGDTMTGSLAMQAQVLFTNPNGVQWPNVSVQEANSELWISGNTRLGGHLLPNQNNYEIGSSAERWNNVWSTRGNFGFDLTVADKAVALSPDAGQTLEWRANGFYSDALDQATADARYLPLSHEPGTDPHPQYLLETTADAKGDLLAASAADTVGRLAVGTDGQVLTADSTQALGVRWGTVSGGGGGLDQATADGLYVNITGDTMTGPLTVQPNLTVQHATSPAFTLKRTADANPRAQINQTSLSFGPGVSAVDVSISRAGANLLSITGGITPSSTNLYDLGSTSNRWRKLWGVDADLSNTLAVGTLLGVAHGGFSAWDTVNGWTAIEVGGSGSIFGHTAQVRVGMASNFYLATGGESRSVVNSPGASLELVNGVLNFSNAPAVNPGELQAYTTRLTVNLAGNAGLGVSPEANWATDGAILRLGTSTSLRGAIGGEGTTDLGKNVLWDGTVNRAIVAGTATLLHQTQDFWDFYAAPSAAAGAVLDLQPRARIGGDGMFLSFQPGCGLTMHDRQSGSAKQWSMYGDSGQVKWFSTERNDNPMWLTPNGTLIVNPVATSNVLQFWTGQGTFAINSPSVGIARLSTDNGVTLEMNASGALSLVSSSSLWLNYNTYAHPTSDNLMHWGHGSYRFVAVYAVNGTIQTSSIKYKDPLGDLDPEAALAAVLRTPARRFKYKGSERVQSGYYMEEADPLFSIGPDEATPSNDAGILLAAIQALYQRLEALR